MIPTKSLITGYGVDVALERADDVDKKVLQYIQHRSDRHVLDIGSGAGGQSARLVQAGACVLAIDCHDYSADYHVWRQRLGCTEDELRFECADVRTMVQSITTATFSIALLQRVLHYISYNDARTVLQTLHSRGVERVYASVTGSNSAIGLAHPKRTAPISERFTTLPAPVAQTFAITKPLCVYNQAELDMLFHDAGFRVVESWVSAFGNCKLVAEHRDIV